VVQHLTADPEIEGSNPAAFERPEKMAEKKRGSLARKK